MQYITWSQCAQIFVKWSIGSTSLLSYASCVDSTCPESHLWSPNKAQTPSPDFRRWTACSPSGPGLRRAALWQPNRLGVSSVCSPLRPPLGPPGGPPGDLHSLPQHTEAPCMVGGKDGTPPCLFPSLTTFRSPASSGLNKLNNFYELSAPPSLPFLESPSKCSSFWALLQMFKYSGLFRSSPAP